MSDPPAGNSRRADEAPPGGLPPGVKLLRTLEGHQGGVYGVAFDRQGETLATGGDDLCSVVSTAGLKAEDPGWR